MKVLLLSFALFSQLLFAQESEPLNMQQMQNMMQEMQKMQTCMAKIDFNALADLEKEAYSIQEEITHLCQQNKRDKAQKTAIDFSNKIMTYPAIVQLKACSKGTSMESMMKVSQQDFEKHHVCDADKAEFGLPSKQRIQW